MSWDESGSNLKLRFQSEEETLEWVRRSYCITYMEWGCARKGNHSLQQKLLGQKVKKSKRQKHEKKIEKECWSFCQIEQMTNLLVAILIPMPVGGSDVCLGMKEGTKD